VDIFRLTFIVILLTAFGLSGYFRRLARRSGEAIPRRREGAGNLFLRLLLAVPFYLSMLAYAVNPGWMAWSALALPAWLRWAGVIVGLATLPLLYWVFHSLGNNISETFLTKQEHHLVTHGPYRWVRHPLYAVASAAFLALGLISANGFILIMSAVILLGVALFVVPREEGQLAAKFGDSYEEYCRRTGGLMPRLKKSRQW
jgi:protein-S-isoprenylcysteine O-methyltransferase Ste14